MSVVVPNWTEKAVVLGDVKIERLADSAWADSDMWPLIRASFWFAALFIVLAIGVYFVRKFRDEENDDSAVDSGSLLTEFRDLHSRGTLSDEEYKTIKTKLAATLRDELIDNDQDKPTGNKSVSDQPS